MNLTVRPIQEAEFQTFRAKIAQGFGSDPYPEEDGRFFRETLDLDRTICAFDGDEMIGTCAAYTFDLTVPGGVLPMGGTTVVTVQPTHRRRGVLTAMMRAHLAEIRARGEPLAGLWASEASIYGRFGFGVAVEAYDLKVDGRTIRFAGGSPACAVRLVEPSEAQRVLPPVYERIRPTRSGHLSRSEAWWTMRYFYDPEHRRRGRSARRYAVCTSADRIDGYAIYRQKDKWEDFPDGTVYVLEVMAATSEAHEALWRFLTRIDLFPNVEYWNLPIDDELPWRVTESRRIRRSIGDTLWLRLIDIPRALEGRRYSCREHLVLDVGDPFLPDNSGRYLLDASPDGARCTATDEDADLELPVDALGALYLGAHRVETLARAHMVKGHPEARAAAGRLFATEPPPWCPEVF
ncbi:MAG: GNAT family N-acetyltransferase [Planctomycetota bacterium]|jgi:predicted acetyltransferase